MAADEPPVDRDTLDVIQEETSRSRRKTLRRAGVIERERRVRKLYEQMKNPNCSRRTFIELVRALGLQEDSKQFQELLSLFDNRTGGR